MPTVIVRLPADVAAGALSELTANGEHGPDNFEADCPVCWLLTVLDRELTNTRGG